jgi:hypothetical protein
MKRYVEELYKCQFKGMFSPQYIGLATISRTSNVAYAILRSLELLSTFSIKNNSLNHRFSVDVQRTD